ncbi:MAG: SUF system NifU family Fe-S cluster assembly protein [Halobacteria archaeon]|nr:SUF system NifU family Fe-S cluster assembly protein [Halobacteria archaeon]
MSRDMYKQNILDHYRNPHNYGEIENPDIEYEDVNPSCGDEIDVYVELDEDGEIVDAKFKGEGCAISQASASMLTDEIKGMTLDEVKDLDRDYIMDMLGIELNPMRVKCAVLGLKVLEGGVAEYEAET